MKTDQNSRQPSPSLTLTTHHTNFNASSAKYKSRPSTQHPIRYKHLFTHTRTNKTLKASPAFTAFATNAVKSTSRPAATYLPESRKPKQISDHQTLARTRSSHQMETSPAHRTSQVLAPTQSKGGNRNQGSQHSSTRHRILHQ